MNEIASKSQRETGLGSHWQRHWQVWSPFVILALAAGLRAFKLAEWSLWEDEETTIYFSQQLAKPFPRFFPVFFFLLNRWYELTGVSVGAGRVLAGAIGVAGVAAVYHACRRLVSQSVGVWAALLLAVNLGHLFWSQSIRYFGLLFVLEILSLYWFYAGFERRKTTLLLLANAAFAVALWTHFSAILVAPVFVGYLILAAWRPKDERGYETAQYLAFFIPMSLILAIFANDLLAARKFLGGMSLASARNPVHVVTTVAAYFGVPALGLALLAPWTNNHASRRTILFLCCCAFVPIAELLVIAQINLVNVTWYYGIVGLFGTVALAGVTLASLLEKGRRRTAGVLGFGAFVYAAALLVGYYTTMSGDRPRWRDAADYLRQTAAVYPHQPNNPAVFASVPGVVAFYLGVDPDATMTDRLVQRAPETPPASAPKGDQWYVMEAGAATPELARWLEADCERVAYFAARTGPKDRTISVFRYVGRKSAPVSVSATLP